MNVLNYFKEVEAVYFDGITDAQEIANWSGGVLVELVNPDGRIRQDMFAIDIPCPGGFTTAGAGFYIFKDGPSYFASDKASFESNFAKRSN